MQWFIDLIKDWVIAQAYATQAWVLAQLCKSTVRVYLSALQSVPNATWTKLQLNLKDWDVNDEFANYRFTAKEAGYYQVNLAAMGVAIPADKRFNIGVYKNGAPHSVTWEYTPVADYAGSYISDIVHLNGTTDYVDAYVYHDSGVTKNVYSSKAYTFMSIHQLSKDSWL